LMTRPPPSSTLFPYTTLFRSRDHLRDERPHESHVVDALGRLGQHHRFACAIPITVQRIGIDNHGVSDSRVCIEGKAGDAANRARSEEHTSELQSLTNLVCRLL